MPLSPFDIIIILIILYNLIQGFRKGLIRSLFFLLGLIIATFLALSFYRPAGEYLYQDFNISHPWAECVSFSIIWLLISFLVNWLGIVLKQVAKFLFIGWLDRLGGVALGLVKAFFLISLILVSLTRLDLSPKIKQSLQDSQLAPHLLKLTPLIYLNVVKVFKDPRSQHYVDWYGGIEEIYQEFTLKH